MIETGAIYIMDRGYIDFTRLHAIHLAGAFFVISAKGNFRFKRLSSQSVDKASGIQCDQIITTRNCRALGAVAYESLIVVHPFTGVNRVRTAKGLTPMFLRCHHT